MTVTLTLPFLMVALLMAALGGVGFTVGVVWAFRIDARMRALEGVVHASLERRTYSSSTEMAVVE